MSVSLVSHSSKTPSTLTPSRSSGLSDFVVLVPLSGSSTPVSRTPVSGHSVPSLQPKTRHTLPFSNVPKLISTRHQTEFKIFLVRPRVQFLTHIPHSSPGHYTDNAIWSPPFTTELDPPSSHLHFSPT